MSQRPSGITPEVVEMLLAYLGRTPYRNGSTDIGVFRFLGTVTLTEIQRTRAAKLCVLRLNSGIMDGCIDRYLLVSFLVPAVPLTISALAISLFSLGTSFYLSLFNLLSMLMLVPILAIVGMLPMLLGTLPLWMAWEGPRWNRARLACIGTLGRLQSPHGVVPLISACASRVEPVRTAAEEAVQELLHGLPPESYPELSYGDQLECFPLLTRQNEGLSLALLDLLEAKGDDNTLRPVAALKRKAQSAQVKARAEEVLQILEARRVAAQNADLLLRASSAGGSADTLLRAGQATPTEPATLLRASEPEP
jgi:hypothetical protein